MARTDPQALLTFSAIRLAAMIRSGDLSSAEAVEAHIRRIEQVNPKINAVVRDRFARARLEATMADETRGPSSPPLHGVPCTIKESFALEGMPNTSGLLARRGVVASSDAPGVARLRRAGAIPLGVSNTSELCMWMESNNRVYGRTRNPYDPRCTVGGSSGGEGAIIGAGGSPFGLGSDVGGSIRMPAFFNGVFGHKPTGGLVPNTGQFPCPDAGTTMDRYVTTGPICRRAEDLMPLLRILAGPDATVGEPGSVELDRLTILDVPDDGGIPIDPELRGAQKRCADLLAARGARVISTRISDLRRSFEIWSAMMSAAGGPSFSELLGQGTPINPLLQLLLWLVGRSPHTLPALGLAALERFPRLSPRWEQQMLVRGEALRRELVERIGNDGVLLYPSHPRPAPRHNAPLLRPFAWAYTGIFNVMQLPATQVPLGLSRRGLPLGLQVVSGPGRDHVTIAVALELERRIGGWRPPPSLYPAAHQPLVFGGAET